MFWLHDCNTLSIRQYGEIDRTGNLSLLRKWWNPFPVHWFNTELFFEEFKDLFNIRSNLGDEKYKLIAYNKILILDRMLRTMSILMRNQNERSLFALLFKVKAKEYKGNLKCYIDRVKFYTGIEIKDGNDLKRLQKEIQRLIDKYAERYSKQQAEPEKTDFIDICFGVFTVMEMAYLPDMKLAEFGRLRILADKRIMKMKNKK